MTHADTTRRVTATLVPEGLRLATLPKYFGRWDIIVEGSIYNWMRALCAEYSGGEWRFIALSNGGIFLAPRVGQYRLVQPENGFDDTVGDEAAGIIVTLCTLSHLSFRYPAEAVFSERFHQLRAFALDHPEAGLIFRAID